MEGVRVPSGVYGGWLAVATNVAPYAAPYAGLPKAGWILLIPMAVGCVIRVLLEWQLRLTLSQIFERAPGGSVVVIRPALLVTSRIQLSRILCGPPRNYDSP